MRGPGEERDKRLPGPVEPSAVGIHQRAPGERVGKPAAHLEPLLDRVAALLDQPPGEVAATSVELGQGQVAEAFRGVRLIAVVARPVRFPGVTFAGRFEIVGALKPDQRNRVRVGRRPSALLERQSPPHQVGPRRPPQQQIQQAQVDQQRREDQRIPFAVHVFHRPFGMLQCARRIAWHRDQDEPRGDPRAQRRVVTCYLERPLQVAGRQRDRPVIPLDLGQQLEPLRLQRRRQTVRLHALSEPPGIGHIPRPQQRRGLAHPPPDQRLAVCRRGEPAGGTEQLGRGVECAAQDGLPGGPLDLCRDGLVGIGEALGKVAGALLRIAHDLSQPAVKRAAACL